MTSAHQLDPEKSESPVPGWLAVPSKDRSAPIWDAPVPRPSGPDPVIWLLGAHGGAGVSTLESVWAPAADSRRGWPAADAAPFVVVVARMHAAGLDAAQQLCVQHRRDEVGGCELLGLVTVAATPGKPAVSLSRRREIVAAAAGASWHIDWVPELLACEPTELAQWTPDYTPPPAKRFARPLAPTDAVPGSVAAAAAEIFAAAGEQWRNRPGKP